MITEELVTIGLTCYNASGSIGRALLSALNQDYPHFEIVVVDDVSSDDSLAVIRGLMAQDPRIRLIQNAVNLGPAGARNQIIAAAQGAFIVFFDDDDWSAPGRVRQQRAAILNAEAGGDDRAVLCYAGIERTYLNGYTKRLAAIGSQGQRPPQDHDIVDFILLNRKNPECFFGSGTPTCCLMVRTKTLRSVDGFDGQMRRVEDADLAIRLAQKGALFIGVDEILVYQTSTAGVDKTPDKNLTAELYLISKNRPYLESQGLFPYAFNWPKLRYFHFTKNYFAFLGVFLRLFAQYPLRVTRHFLDTAPKRLLHERAMRAR